MYHDWTTRTGQDWDKISGKEIWHSSRPSHTPTTNSETTDNPIFFFLWPSHLKKKVWNLRLGPCKISKGSLLNCTFTSIFLFSLFIFHDISLCVCLLFSTNFLVPVNFPISHLLLWTELSPPCCKTTTSLYSVCINIILVQFKVWNYDHVLWLKYYRFNETILFKLPTWQNEYNNNYIMTISLKKNPNTVHVIALSWVMLFSYQN